MLSVGRQADAAPSQVRLGQLRHGRLDAERGGLSFRAGGHGGAAGGPAEEFSGPGDPILAALAEHNGAKYDGAFSFSLSLLDKRLSAITIFLKNSPFH